MCGNRDEGRAMALRAQKLNPRDPRGWLMSGVLALASVIDEDYAEAARLAEQALAQNGRFAVALRVLAVALVKLGQTEQARIAVSTLLRVEPDLTVSAFFARIPVPLASMARTYAESLQIAGLPE
jgi:tetratricopeptide (TPR) repeat protein